MTIEEMEKYKQAAHKRGDECVVYYWEQEINKENASLAEHYFLNTLPDDENNFDA